MDLFMPAERVLYNRSYYFSDEAVDDYNEYIADRDGVNVDVVSSLDFFMNEVWKEIDYAIDNDLSDEISRFDRMLRDLKCGGDPEHPTEISVVAKGAVERWDEPSRGLVVADSLLSLVQGTGSADALKDCQIDRLVDTNGDFHIEASHHDGSAYLDVRLISGISYDAKGFKLGGEYYAPGKMDLADKFGFSYDIDFSGLSFKTSLILSVNGLYSEGDVIDAASDWQEDYLPCVCHRGGQGEDDRWEYEPAEDYRPFTRPADIPESIFDKLCASQGTTVEKVVNDPVTPFERSFREDIFNMPQNRPVGLAVLATLPLDAFLDASLSMICRGEGENAGTFTVKPGTYEPIFGIYDPVGGCGGTMGTLLDRDFEIDPHDISYTMMEPVRGEWKSDRIDLYTPQDCFGFSNPFGGRIEYSEKKPKAVVAVKPDPVELGHRASVAASSTAGGRARGAGIKQ